MLWSAAIVDKTDFVAVRFRYRSQRAYSGRFFSCYYVVSVLYFVECCSVHASMLLFNGDGWKHGLGPSHVR